MCLCMLSDEAREVDVLYGIMRLSGNVLSPMYQYHRPINNDGWQYAEKVLTYVMDMQEKYYTGFHLFENFNDAIMYAYGTVSCDFVIIAYEIRDVVVQGVERRRYEWRNVTVVGERRPLWIAYDSKRDGRVMLYMKYRETYEAYQQGYKQGFKEGQEDALEAAKERAYEEGKRDGHKQGYRDFDESIIVNKEVSRDGVKS